MTLNRIADGQPVRAHDYPWLAFILPSEVLINLLVRKYLFNPNSAGLQNVA